MALILNIDTAIDTASVCLAKDAEVLSIAKNEKQKDHAAWLHLAIKEIFEKNALELKTIDATAVTGGPGSYTGLRIGMATVKGICYALAKPMIILNTLQVMANAAKNEKASLLCPMIDARRMEVFTAMYSKALQTIKEPSAITLNGKSFDEELANQSICFFGNGSDKFRSIKQNANAFFSSIDTDASHMVSLSEEKFSQKEFAELAYAEPLYLKEFYTPAR
ncbi:MAG TPA: tRNA (adenosine(37)-N6)-threonylcarbamoyltransferase complex dimerization subunit type 1 TsaB [Chitinophagaceae bacterium]|nr:tRNA (adenosine(37)-N6)-threonylcarbamoyltransferase complex dimerization subunit type 1 TsaB [Chitinophagaceae bacterium]